jgi:hypothetical protein
MPVTSLSLRTFRSHPAVVVKLWKRVLFIANIANRVENTLLLQETGEIPLDLENSVMR